MTGLCGSMLFSRSLRLRPVEGAFEGADFPGWGLGVGRSVTGRSGPARCVPAFPARGPGDATPLGPGEGAVPFEASGREEPCVGLGLGTPGLALGAALARATAAGEGLGEADAFTALTAVAVGAAVAAGAGVCGFAVGAAVGAGGRGEGLAVGAVVGTGEGAAVGGTLTVTATATAVGTEVGTAGNSLEGDGSITACVGCTFGSGVACGSGVGLGGAVGANFESSCRAGG